MDRVSHDGQRIMLLSEEAKSHYRRDVYRGVCAFLIGATLSQTKAIS